MKQHRVARVCSGEVQFERARGQFRRGPGAWIREVCTLLSVKPDICRVVQTGQTGWKTSHYRTMAMEIPREQLLRRWRSLQDDTGLIRAARLARLLWVAGLLLALFVTYAVAYKLSPILIAAVSAIAGWDIAERNALRLRISQWPIFSEYIDWDRVRRDCGDGT
jgi:hypothetical protein